MWFGKKDKVVKAELPVATAIGEAPKHPRSPSVEPRPGAPAAKRSRWRVSKQSVITLSASMLFSFKALALTAAQSSINMDLDSGSKEPATATVQASPSLTTSLNASNVSPSGHDEQPLGSPNPSLMLTLPTLAPVRTLADQPIQKMHLAVPPLAMPSLLTTTSSPSTAPATLAASMSPCNTSLEPPLLPQVPPAPPPHTATPKLPTAGTFHPHHVSNALSAYHITSYVFSTPTSPTIPRS
ncbi:hypothetical protein DXG01_004075 [Tephrocybe rancida]|nr:hypothetical protein DXG01_004075 [Tephrocybe rancida]